MTTIEKSIVNTASPLAVFAICKDVEHWNRWGPVMQKIFVALLSSLASLVFCAPAHAANLPEAARQEVNQLLARLENSDCQFSRNGSWHDAKAARAHLQRKFDYLQDKSLISSTEQFIELGASKSSVSGKPYLVQCSGAPRMESRAWLLAQLKQVRSQAAK